MRTITIGGDELILWLRKNNIASDISNDGAHGLGFEICRIIERLGGKKIEDNHPVIWPIDDPNLIDGLKLPKTAAQYKIDIQELPKIYSELSEL